MMRYLLPCFYAFLCCLAFSFVFELRNWRYILAASFTGAVSWAVFLAAGSGTIAYFLATIAVAGLAELFARIFKVPATVFIIVGIIPMVPGGGMYYTMDALVSGNMPLFVERGMQTAASAGAIAVGCSLVTSLARILTWRKREKK